MQRATASWRRRGQSIGFVPTMGALHRGHESLIRRARKENDRVVVSVFVNPLQFGPKDDFKRYPRPFRKDRDLCRMNQVDAIYHPTVKSMYPDEASTIIDVSGLSERLEGRFRPGHFSGVATVVAKLFAAVSPTSAYFGEKDFQQLQVIRRMSRDLDLPVTIVACPTVRERDGLALSSRNAYLSSEDRKIAPMLFEGLKAAVDAYHSGVRDPRKARAAALSIIRRIPGSRVDYVEIADPDSLLPVRRLRSGHRILAAIRLGRTRLIDNLKFI